MILVFLRARLIRFKFYFIAIVEKKEEKILFGLHETNT